MTTPATLHFFCGKMASGKSTLARKISTEQSLILLMEDQFLGGLYPDEINSVSDYSSRSARLRSTLQTHLVMLLTGGVSLVLDFPANTKQQRNWMSGLIAASGADHMLHLIDCSDSICKERLVNRAIEQPEKAATDTPEMFDAITKHFDPPMASDGFTIIRYQEPVR